MTFFYPFFRVFSFWGTKNSQFSNFDPIFQPHHLFNVLYDLREIQITMATKTRVLSPKVTKNRSKRLKVTHFDQVPRPHRSKSGLIMGRRANRNYRPVKRAIAWPYSIYSLWDLKLMFDPVFTTCHSRTRSSPRHRPSTMKIGPNTHKNMLYNMVRAVFQKNIFSEKWDFFLKKIEKTYISDPRMTAQTFKPREC